VRVVRAERESYRHVPHLQPLIDSLLGRMAGSFGVNLCVDVLGAEHWVIIRDYQDRTSG
jgi:hypothetical protein